MNKIATLRKAAHITQSEMAYALGIKQNTLSQYETGKRRPNEETLQLIATYLGVSPDFLKDSPYDVFKKDISLSTDDMLGMFLREQADEDFCQIHHEYNDPHTTKHATPNETQTRIIRDQQRTKATSRQWQQQREYEKNIFPLSQIEQYNKIDTASLLSSVELLQSSLLDLLFFEISLAVKCNILSPQSLNTLGILEAHSAIEKGIMNCNESDRVQFNELYATYIPSILYAIQNHFADPLHDIDKKIRADLSKNCVRVLQKSETELMTSDNKTDND